MVNLADLRKKVKDKKKSRKKPKKEKKTREEKVPDERVTPETPTPPEEEIHDEPEGSLPVLQEEEMESYLLFRVGREWFGLSIDIIMEILPMPSLTPVPLAPKEVLGITSLRGKVIPLISMNKLFNIPDHTSKEPVVIVIEKDKEIIGCVVDEVKQSFSIAPSQIEIPYTQGDYARGLVRLKDRLVILLEEDRL